MLRVMVKNLSPVLRAVAKLGGVKQTVAALGGDVTEVMVRYWLKRDRVPPERVGGLSRCSGVPVEEFADHERDRYLIEARRYAEMELR